MANRWRTRRSWEKHYSESSLSQGILNFDTDRFQGYSNHPRVLPAHHGGWASSTPPWVTFWQGLGKSLGTEAIFPRLAITRRPLAVVPTPRGVAASSRLRSLLVSGATGAAATGGDASGEDDERVAIERVRTGIEIVGQLAVIGGPDVHIDGFQLDEHQRHTIDETNQIRPPVAMGRPQPSILMSL